MTLPRLELLAAHSSSGGSTAVTLDGEAAWSGDAEPNVTAEAASDDELMRMARSGARRAFDELIRRHQGRAIRIALRHTGGLAIAQEIAQETFVDLFRALPSYRARGKFSAFLFRILINRCRMEYRRRRTRETDSALTLAAERRDEVTSLDIILARERERRLELEIQRLSKPLRDVLALWGEGLADKEIGEILGKPLGTVRRRRFEAVEKLRQRLLRPHWPHPCHDVDGPSGRRPRRRGTLDCGMSARGQRGQPRAPRATASSASTADEPLDGRGRDRPRRGGPSLAGRARAGHGGAAVRPSLVARRSRERGGCRARRGFRLARFTDRASAPTRRGERSLPCQVLDGRRELAMGERARLSSR